MEPAVMAALVVLAAQVIVARLAQARTELTAVMAAKAVSAGLAREVLHPVSGALAVPVAQAAMAVPVSLGLPVPLA
jgi:hypothetical protein